MAISPTSGFAAVEGALRRAAAATGTTFDFLMRTAKRESGFNAGAKAATSSAAGLFQFVEQTWMAMLKRHGDAHGYGDYAGMIEQGRDGRYRVDGAEARRAVMALRYDPHAASLMAGELASDHAAYLRGRVGREPTGGELYMAHFLGPQGSARLIEANTTTPGARAASLFPAAAAANRGVFYRNGEALTVAEVYAGLSSTGGAAPAVGPAQGFMLADAAGTARRARMEAEAEMVRLLLGEPDEDKSAAGSMFSAEMLAMLSAARDERNG